MVNGHTDVIVPNDFGQINSSVLLGEMKDMVRMLRNQGVEESDIMAALHEDELLPELIITKDYRILLGKERKIIHLEPLVKAVYLLFLRHPEGIMFKCLPDYREELARIYSKLKPAGLTDKALQSIEDVTNPMLNSINEKCARIRGAFVGQFDDYMAKSYYIDGLRGEVKKVSLPRNLVAWE